MLHLATIGVYGFDERTFFEALQSADVDTVCDIRRRRGVRGREYAFANSQRLQRRLAELGIRYVHSLALAPATTLRREQDTQDRATHTAKRQRTILSPVFSQAYQRDNLARFEPDAWLAELPADAHTVALLCVEREPEACHRGLAAAHMQRLWGCSVTHLRP